MQSIHIKKAHAPYVKATLSGNRRGAKNSGSTQIAQPSEPRDDTLQRGVGIERGQKDGNIMRVSRAFVAQGSTNFDTYQMTELR